MKPRDDILVLGLGSPFGDDRLGWEAVARLAQAGVAGAVLVRDGVDLLLELEGHDEVIVIDASNPAGCPGRVRKIEWPSDELGGDALWSTHGLGLAAALEMAAALNRLPRQVTIYTVEAAAGPARDSLSDAALAGLERVVNEIVNCEIIN